METPSIGVDSLGAWTQMALTSRCHMSVPLTKVHRSLRILDQRPNGAPTRDVQEQAADLLRLTEADREERLPSARSIESWHFHATHPSSQVGCGVCRRGENHFAGRVADAAESASSRRRLACLAVVLFALEWLRNYVA